MASPREFSVVRELSRREVERHQKRFVGITVSAPEHRDVNGKLEWVVDVRVGYDLDWALIKDCGIAQWAVGIVTDMNVPVLCERGESGKVTVIARSDVRLPDIALDTYSLADLGMTFMSGVVRGADGVHRDGFGHEVTDPAAETGTSNRYRWTNPLIEWGSTDFDYGTTPLDATDPGWEEY